MDVKYEGGQEKMNKNPALFNKTLVLGIIILFIGVCIQPGVSAFGFNKNKSELQNNELVEITTQIMNHGKMCEIKTDMTATEAEKLKLTLCDLHNALINGDKDGIQLAYEKIENKNILGCGFLKIISKYQQLSDDNGSLFALVLAKANSSLKIPTYLILKAIISTFPPPYRGFFFLTNMLHIIMNVLLPFLQFRSLIELLIIDEGSCHSRSITGSWDASSDLTEDPFGAAFILYTGIFILIDFDLEPEEFPYEFLFVCGYSLGSAYIPYMGPFI